MTAARARPRVALLAHKLVVPDPTGVARYVVELTRAIAALPGRPGAPEYVAASVGETEEPDWFPDGIELGRIRGPRKLLSVGWTAVRRPRVDRSLGSPDLVHALYPWAVTPTAAPLVVTIHDLMPITQPSWYPRKERWLSSRAIANAVERAACIVTDAQVIADQVAALGVEPERIEVVHAGVGDEFFDTGDEGVEAVCARHGVAPGRYFIAVGAVSTRKNLPVVRRARAPLPPSGGGHGPELLVAGPDGLGAGEIRDLAASVGVAGRVRFGGFVVHEDLPPLLAGAIALVHPSYDEGFGLTPLEAMAAGTPAVTSDRGSLPEVVGAAGTMLDPEDVDAWAAALATLRDDEERRRAQGAAGRQWAEEFRWAKAAARVRELHERVLGRH